ncbi:MAG: hypothetical protein AB9873_16070 [Syntrophobacteraceae bacterium]
MIVVVKNELSKSGMVVKVQKLKDASVSAGTKIGPQSCRYRCFLARPGRALHAHVSTPVDERITIADLFGLLSRDRRGRDFLKGFKSTDKHLNALPLDEPTDVKDLADSCLPKASVPIEVGFLDEAKNPMKMVAR